MSESSDFSVPSIDGICDCFLSACRRGERPRIEDFLIGCDDSNRVALVRNLLQIEIAWRDESGETLQLSDYQKRFPGIFSGSPSLLDELNVESTQASPETAETVNDVHSLVDQLQRLRLISPEHHSVLEAELGAQECHITSESLCHRLMNERYLTPFQFQAISRGDIRSLKLGEYLLQGQLGQGGMGVVYKALQPSLNRQVALKTILAREDAGEESIRRFRQEAESAARLSYPGIVPVFEFGEADGVHFFAMGLIEGVSLSERLAQSVLSPRDAAKTVQQLAESVAYAHRQGVVHRDLKPANVLLDQAGATWITDFGLAKLIDQDGQTVSGQVLGTPGYMPPEQAQGKSNLVREPADVYALGAILYACLSGHPPFKADSVMATLKLVIEQAPIPLQRINHKIPADLDTVCLKCLEKDPLHRYASAEILADELRRFLNGEPVRARPQGRVQRLVRWSYRNPLIAGLSVLSAGLLLAGTLAASYFAVLAQQRAERAEEGTQTAVRTLETVVYSVSEKLRNMPAAREVRQEILSGSMKQLEALSSSTDRINAGTASVLVRYSDDIYEVGADDTLGTLADAERFSLRAIQIFEQCLKQEPQNPRYKSELAYACLGLGNMYLDQRRLSETRPLLERAQSIYRELLPVESDRKNLRRLLSLTLVYCGEMLQMSGETTEALKSYDEAIVLAEQLHQEYPTDLIIMERLIDAVEQKAELLSHGTDLESAQQQYQRTKVLTDECLAVAPNDPIRLVIASIYYERLGDFALRRGDLETARQHFELELDVTIRGVDADRKNVRLRNDLNGALNKLCNVYEQLQLKTNADSARARVSELLQRTK